MIGDCIFDLTSEQFGDTALNYSGNPLQSREIHFAKEEKRLRLRKILILKREGNYRKGGATGFDTSINRLQAQGYVLISNFVYLQDRHGKEYGWGVAEYSTPEKFFGDAFTSAVYRREPAESYQRMLDYFFEILPDVPDKALQKFLK